MKLGEIIRCLENFERGNTVRFDFCHFNPTVLASSRGYYHQLALGYEPPNGNTVTVGKLLDHCRSAVGKTFDGYKGGKYKMDLNTDVYVDNYGEWTETCIVDIVPAPYRTVIIVTAQEEF